MDNLSVTSQSYVEVISSGSTIRDGSIQAAFNTSSTVPVLCSISDVFSARVRETPEALAVHSWDGRLTYDELDEWITYLACRLRKLGVGPGSMVPICFEKSKCAVVAMFAIMRAGGAFVPLEPDHPVDRLGAITTGIQARVLLASKKHAELLQEFVQNVVVVEHDSDRPLDMQELEPQFHSPTRAVAPSDIAYVLFTSGSTGRPKGCVVSHTAICSSALAHSKAFNLQANRRVLQFASYAFDACICEIVTSLTVGACVCIPSDDERSNDLSGAINRYNADWMFMAPSTLSLLHPDDVPSIRTLVVGGEVVPQIIITQWAEKVELFNGYGPTETVVFATCQRCETNTNSRIIGKGIGANCWVVDMQERRLCNVGEAGELLIETPAIANGYLNDSCSTEASFFDVPYWLTDYAKRRLYRTGDIVKWTTAGLLEIVGRRDNQVKLRGQRMELEDTEHAILSTEHVNAVVTAIVGHTLVAVLSFIGSDDGKDVLQIKTDVAAVEKARHDVSSKLPRYMVPTRWVVVNKLPLKIASGKIDRARIKEWVSSIQPNIFRNGREGAKEHPELSKYGNSQTEDIVRRCCIKVLNLAADEELRHCSFLELGGDSITAMQLVSLCKSNSVKVTVKQILKAKTPFHLAQLAEPDENSGQDTDDGNEEAYRTPFELSPIQQFYFGISPEGENHFNQGFLLEIKDNFFVSKAQLRESIEVVIARHMMLRARFSKDKTGKWWQHIVPEYLGGSYLLDAAEDLSQESMLQRVASLQSRLDLRRGPLMAFGHWRLESGPTFFFSTCHHAVIDLVSWRVILQEIEEYLQIGRISNPRTMDYPKFLQLLNQHCLQNSIPSHSLQNSVKPPSLNYWGLSNVPNRVEDISNLHFILDVEATKALLGHEIRSKLGTEVVDLLVGSLVSSFHMTFPDRVTPTIFNEGHGREAWDTAVDVSRTIGWFTTLLPLWSSCEEGDIIDTILDIKDQRRTAPLNGLLYFAERYLNPKEVKEYASRLSSEVIFNYEGVFQQFECADGLFKLSPLSTPHQLHDNSPTSNRITAFEWTATIKHGQLHVGVDYHRCMHHQARIEDWVKSYEVMLRSLPGMVAQIKPRVTRSDFASVKLSASTWTQLRQDLGGSAADCLEDIYGCTPTQEGMLISQSRDAELYLVRVTALLVPKPGGQPIETKKLHDAWSLVVKRHAALRTIFSGRLPECGIFSQLVFRDEIPKEIGEEGPCQFVARVNADGSASVVIRISHVAADAGSLGIILQDLGQAYDGRLSLDQPPLYSHYITWCMEQPRIEAVKYWTAYTQGMTPCLMLKGEISLSLEQPPESTSYARCNVQVPHPSDIQRARIYHNVTTTHILHASWALVLRAFLAQDDVCFGYFVSDREVGHHGAQEAVGVFINTLVCRVALEANPTIAELLSSIRDDCVDGMTRLAGCSLAAIQHNLGLQGEKLFDTGISVQRDWMQTWNSKTCTAEKVDWSETNDFGLAINAIEKTDSLEVSISYVRGAISEVQLQRISTAFSVAIGIVSNIHRASSQILDVHLASTDDMQQIKVWNGPDLGPVDDCIHNVFHTQALRTPANTAISSWDGEMSYQDLDEASTAVALYLIHEAGIALGEAVPFCFKKSRWVLVAILGILKAGGAFVPLDPSHPRERLRHIVTSTTARIVIASYQNLGIIDGLVPQVLELGESRIADLVRAMKNIEVSKTLPLVRPGDRAAIMYTSGSTGRPKGCIWSHKNWCSSSTRQLDALHLREAKRVLQFASYTFDASMVELLTPLQNGATVCIISDEDRLNNLQRCIETTGVDYVQLPPSVVPSINSFSAVKTLLCGGESLDRLSIERWAGKLRLIFGYGFTEGAVATASKVISPCTSSACLGRPFNGSVWVVDPWNYNNLLPIGAIGELVVSGPHIFQGYLNEPSMTAEVLVTPDWMPNTQFYRTGDLVKLNPSDGDLIFMGRRDAQVKINAVRVELGEVETQLEVLITGVSGVAAEVIVSEDSKRTKLLVAFVALGEDFDGDDPLNSVNYSHASDLAFSPATWENLSARIEGIDAKLAEKLPRAMIPSLFVPIRKIPLTSSGKVDRPKLKDLGRRLLASSVKLPTSRTSHGKAPATDMERRILYLWEEFLPKIFGDSGIGVNDNFFHLGGDSLAAMQLVARARTLGLEITVADIFQAPVLADLAARVALSSTDLESKNTLNVEPFSLVSEREKSPAELANIAMQCGVETSHIQDLYPCTPLQQGMLALSARYLGSHMAHLVIDVTVELDVSRLKQSIMLLVRQNPILRTRFIDSQSGQVLQVVLDDSPVLDLDKPVGLFEYLETVNKDYIEFGQSLSRFSRVVDGDVEVLVWSVHHCLYDGWSLPMMLHDLGQLYQGRRLPPPRTPFNVFVSHVESGGAKEFWDQYTKDGTPSSFPPLPQQDYQPTPSATFERSHIEVSGGIHGVTVSTLIRAAWGLTCCAFGDSSDVVFGVTLTGRDTAVPGIESVAGPTIATVPLRVRISSSETISQLLSSVHGHVTEMIPHQHFGLQNISKLSAAARKASTITSLLVVHPAKDSEAHDGCFVPRMHVSEGINIYTTHGFILQCQLGRGGFVARCHFDAAILAPEDAKMVLDHFEKVVQLLDLGSGTIPISDFARADTKAAELVHRLKEIRHNATYAQSHEMPQAKEDYQPPMNLIESEIQAVWSSVLARPRSEISTLQSFVYLGGDSVSAMQAVARCRKAGIENIRVQDILQASGIVDLANSIEQVGSRSSANTDTMEATPIDVHLLDLVVSELGVVEDEIEAIVQATEMQTVMVKASLERPRRLVGYFTFDFVGYVDEQRLRAAWQRVVQQHSVLRTVFTQLDRRVYHVVLKQAPLIWSTETCSDFDCASEQWIATSQERQLEPKELFMRLHFLQKHDEAHSRLLLEISHAQYDGLSYQLLIQCLQRAYDDMPETQAPQMFELLQWKKWHNNEASSRSYWRQVLEGASPTELISPLDDRRLDRTEFPLLENTLRQTVNIKCKDSWKEFSFATVLKAAWAGTLALAAQTSDVVFGQNVSGRNLGFRGIEKVLGACVNTIPVRVQISSGNPGTWRSLMQQVQQQQSNGLAYENLGLNVIMESCATWTQGDRLSSVINHLSHSSPTGGRSSGRADSAKVGEAECRLSCTAPPDNSTDIGILSTMTGVDEIELSMVFSEQAIPRIKAQTLLDLLCRNLGQCMADPSGMFAWPQISDGNKIASRYCD